MTDKTPPAPEDFKPDELMSVVNIVFGIAAEKLSYKGLWDNGAFDSENRQAISWNIDGNQVIMLTGEYVAKVGREISRAQKLYISDTIFKQIAKCEFCYAVRDKELSRAVDMTENAKVYQTMMMHCDLEIGYLTSKTIETAFGRYNFRPSHVEIVKYMENLIMLVREVIGLDGDAIQQEVLDDSHHLKMYILPDTLEEPVQSAKVERYAGNEEQYQKQLMDIVTTHISRKVTFIPRHVFMQEMAPRVYIKTIKWLKDYFKKNSQEFSGVEQIDISKHGVRFGYADARLPYAGTRSLDVIESFNLAAQYNYQVAGYSHQGRMVCNTRKVDKIWSRFDVSRMEIFELVDQDGNGFTTNLSTEMNRHLVLLKFYYERGGSMLFPAFMTEKAFSAIQETGSDGEYIGATSTYEFFKGVNKYLDAHLIDLAQQQQEA